MLFRSLSSLGAKAALEILCNEFAERSGLMLHKDIDCPSLRPGLDIAVYRMVQEAMTNIGKYAQATQVWVSVQPVDRHLLVEVRDDGIGFDARAVGPGHHGLLGMRFRMQAERGELNVDSSPGAGTRVTARVPLDLAEPAFDQA